MKVTFVVCSSPPLSLSPRMIKRESEKARERESEKAKERESERAEEREREREREHGKINLFALFEIPQNFYTKKMRKNKYKYIWTLKREKAKILSAKATRQT